MKITITRKHNRTSSMTSSTNCAVAKAIRDSIEVNWVSVGTEEFAICVPGQYRNLYIDTIPIPGRIQWHIVKLLFTPPWLRWIYRERSFQVDLPYWVKAREVKPRLRSSLLARILARVELRGLPGISQSSKS